MQKTNQRQAIRALVGMALFAALAYVVMLVVHIPVQFLTFDAKDAVITVAGFIYGPLPAVGISLTVALVEMISVSGTGIWGFLMNFLSSAAFSGVASLLYKLFRSAHGALVALGTSIVTTTGVMLLLNLAITPLYLGVPLAAVKELLVPLLLPFNFAKACLNASVTMLLYKPIITALRRAGLVARERYASSSSLVSEENVHEKRPLFRFNRLSVLIIAVAAVLAAVAVTLFIVLNNR